MSANDGNDFDWTREEVIKLIKLYQSEISLWNASCSAHKNRNYKIDALNNIAGTMQLPVTEVEKKIHSLRSQYFREKSKVLNSQTSGAGRGNVYIPKWYCFKYLQFLSDHKNSKALTAQVCIHLPYSLQDMDGLTHHLHTESINHRPKTL